MAIVSPPVVDGTYPVIAFSDPFGVHVIESVERTPEAVTVTTVAHVAEAIALVPNAAVPEAIVSVTGR